MGVLFAVSGDSCLQLLLAWFLRPATAAPGPYDAGKEASRVSWTGGSPAPCRAVGQPSVWGPVPLPAAAFPLLSPARQAFPSLRLLAGGRPAPWPRPGERRLSPPGGWPPKAASLSPSVYFHQTPSLLNPNPSQRGVTSVTSGRSLLN